MVELLGGQETIPQDVGHPQSYTVEQVSAFTQEGFGPSPAESQMILDLAIKERAIQENRERLAAMESAAQLAHETYYAEGGGPVTELTPVGLMSHTCPLMPRGWLKVFIPC